MAIEGNLSYKPRILVAPLDWGLGHATRCIPVIRALLNAGAQVLIASDGPQETLLKEEFRLSGEIAPAVDFITLPGYRVSYAKNGGQLLWKLLTQVPRLLRTIREEHAWLQQTVKTHRIDGVISDNRFGLYHPDIPCIFLTHQLLIKTGPDFRADPGLIERRLQRFNYKYIDRFTECWVPDQEGHPNYAGDLSHPVIKPAIPLKYLGILSRLEHAAIPGITDAPDNTDQPHLFISLSGPEPQRTMLEDLIVEQVSHYNGSAVIVRGLPGEDRLIPSTNSLKFYNHLDARRIAEEMAKADIVIARSGYSTVMDLMKLGKRSILVPTPGQTEQEYLAAYLQVQRLAMKMDQKGFKLGNAIKKSTEFHYDLAPENNSRLETVIAAFLQGIRTSTNDQPSN